jgi:hypothetical protein
MTKHLPEPSMAFLAMLLGFGALFGEAGFRWVLPDMLWAASSFLASVAGGVLTFVWSVRKHAEEKLRGLTGLSITEMRTAEAILADVGGRVLALCIWLVVCISTALLPWGADQLAGASWHWMYLLSGASLGGTVFALLISIRWREQIDRAARDRQIEAEAARRQADLVAQLQKEARDVSSASDWGKQSPLELGS